MSFEEKKLRHVDTTRNVWGYNLQKSFFFIVLKIGYILLKLPREEDDSCKRFLLVPRDCSMWHEKYEGQNC